MDRLTKDFNRRLATALNEKIGVPGMDESQEQTHFEEVVGVASSVLKTLLKNL